MSIPRDVQEFLEGYPDNEDDPSLNANLKFYSNTARCRPDNLLINELHERWKGDYDVLENKHGFIQWIFPIQEFGMNYWSQPLQKHEIERMKASPEIVKRVITSYELMLDFYGMRLVSAETGQVDRSLPPRYYKSQYENLTWSSHNNLRISRILKCLSELGLERFNAGLLLHMLNEQSESGELNSRSIRSSMDRWWANCIRNSEERRWVGDMIAQVRSGAIIFTRQNYLDALERRQKTGSFDEKNAEGAASSEGLESNAKE
ncbi:hypothetical protein FISHEDRAFT_49021 [Fistulina hepatica ATCC 64428]|uniref:Opioid growth factor receptor (OGFr) conserved domain-containing protein n=1 Tax=Fistulina hepatica ATCC 64428 TaxID=1128425 RepID=A0A0D7A3M7_9AGAR|nr:hypothetical protein FISHEDRAFT_49021 [Fistulina hepatica ATCC 64428]